MIYKTITYFILLLLLNATALFAQHQTASSLDILSYHLTIEPNISEETIQGDVIITFTSEGPTSNIELDAGHLIIDKVVGKTVQSFKQNLKKLEITFSEPFVGQNQVQIFYYGAPKNGAIFLPEYQQMYTVFSTDEWLVCNMDPSDKASIRMEIILPDSLQSIASGLFIDSKSFQGDKVIHTWKQPIPAPAYAFGMVIGNFSHASSTYNNIDLNFFATKNMPEELLKIFETTGNMISFFEEKTGIPYFQKSYTQVLVGNYYQEMAGLSILKQSYGDLILKDSTEINLISHELAHQWWGNMITNKNWNHFWLNEAFATFMSAAYNEHRFGEDQYKKNINSYKQVYERIKAKGNDKALVFENWDSPTSDDRSLVYFKGAYVLHELRLELGDVSFWKGIKYYSQKFYGQTVTTKDFQHAMETSSNKILQPFFDKWVY